MVRDRVEKDVLLRQRHRRDGMIVLEKIYLLYMLVGQFRPLAKWHGWRLDCSMSHLLAELRERHGMVWHG